MSDEKHFYELSQNGRTPLYWICATSQDAARATLSAAGTDFEDLDPSERPLDWRELSLDDAAKLRCDTGEDGRDRGKISLTECDLGEWFSSEW